MHPAPALLAAAVLACLPAHAQALAPLSGSTLRCANASAPLVLVLQDASGAAQPARCADARGTRAPGPGLNRTTYDNLTHPQLLSPLPPAGACADPRRACLPEAHASPFFTDTQYICVCAAGWFRPDAGSACTRVPVPTDGRLVSPAHTDALFACAPPSVAAGDACEATSAAAENGAYMGAYLLPPEPDAQTHTEHPPPLHVYAAPPCAHAMRYNFTLQTCQCAPGYVSDPSTSDACTLCARDHYCPGGAQQRPCARTLYAGAQSVGECVCAPGAYRAGNQPGGACVPVPENDTSTLVPACTRPEDSGVTCDVQTQCPSDTRCAAGQEQPCPDGTYFDALAGGSRCAACELGFWCRGGARRPCPANSSTRRVGAADVQQCRCARNHTRVAGLGRVHCRYSGAGGGVQQSLAPAPPPPPLADFGARLVHWHAEPPSAITAVALEHLALAPVRANHVRLHVHAGAHWRTLADLGLGDAALASTSNFSDLQVSPDTPAPGLLSVAFLRTDARLQQISLLRAEVNATGANLTLVRAHAPAVLTAQDPYANGTLVLPAPVRAALALLRCRRAPVFAERNVTRELPVFEVDSNGTQGNITNATMPVQVLETFELGRPRVCTLTLYALDSTLDSVPRREVVLATDTDTAHVRWHADGRRLCVNATHYVDAESALLAAWAAPDACTPLPPSTPEPDAREGAAAPEACAAPLVRVGELCTACPANHTCDAAGRIAPCPPNALTVAQDATRCVCGGGAFLHSAERGCVPVPAGGYSGANDARLHACPQNTTSARGAASKNECQCLPGFYSNAETRQCAACAHGTYQPAQNQSTCLPCPGAPAQVTTARTASTSAAACVCAAGSYGTPDAGCAPCTQLPAGVVCLQATARVQDAVQCSATARPAANANRTRCVCAPGTYLLGEVCHACGFGWFCDETRGIARTQCPRGTQTARALATSDAECECTAPGTTVVLAAGERRCVCDGGAGYYDVGGRCARCPPNSCTARTGCDCLLDCLPGYHTDAAGVCRLCAPGSYCSGQHGERARLCPRGTYGVIEGQSRLRDCVPCAPGVVLEGGEEARPHHPPHLACAGELVGIEGSALGALPAAPAVLWQAQGREATGTAATAASVAAANDKLAFVLRSPNVTQAFASRSHAGQLRVSAHAHPGFAASLFRALQGAPEPRAEWVALRALLAARHDRHAAVAQYLFCALLWHELQHAWKPGAASMRCEAEADAGAALPADVRSVAREAVHAALNIVLADDPRVRLEAIPELSVLRGLLQTQLGAPSADHVHLSVVAGRVVVTWSDAAASAPALLRAASFWRTLEPMLTVTGLALGGDACGVLPPDELAYIPAAAGQLVCTRCRPGREFRDAATGLCTGCTLARSACREDAYAFRPCSATGDAECVQVQDERQTDTCGNGRHTLDEVCDFTDADSPLQPCCTSECKLKPGYYAFPNCSTICGDDIVAKEVEECDEISPKCDLRTCQYIRFL